MKKLTVEDLPKEIVDGMIEKINNNEKYKELVRRRVSYLKNGNYVLALQVSKTMEKIFKDSLAGYIKFYEGEVRKINELTSSMNEDDKEKMAVLGNAVVLLADCLESICRDTNELLHKYHPEFNIEMFDKLNQLANESRRACEIIGRLHQLWLLLQSLW